VANWQLAQQVEGLAVNKVRKIIIFIWKYIKIIFNYLLKFIFNISISKLLKILKKLFWNKIKFRIKKKQLDHAPKLLSWPSQQNIQST
jgi:hypothetical protein